MKFTRKSILFCLVIVTLLLAGCATPAAPTEAPAQPAAPEAPAEPVATEAPAEPVATEAPAEPAATEAPAEPEMKTEYDIAVIRWSPDDIYFNGVQLGQEMERDAIQTAEGVKINFNVFGANDVSQQITALQAQLDRGVDGVLLVPWRGEAMIPIVTEMREMGLPVVVSNAYVPEAPQVFVAFDNQAAGRLAGEQIVDFLNKNRGEDWPQKGGVIIELRCIITASFDIGRHTGYHEVFDPIVAENPGVIIEEREAGCDGSKARKAVDDIIARYGPDQILAVASIDGTMGIGGATPALEAAGIFYPTTDPKHIPVTTVDATQPELAEINKCRLLHSSVQPAVAEGLMTMRLLWEMIKTGQIIETPAEPTQILTEGTEPWMPVDVIPSDNFDGVWYKTQTYSVPYDLAVDSPINWGNAHYEAENGEAPVYDGECGLGQ
jgi:ribose transport system substrate-binding protein